MMNKPSTLIACCIIVCDQKGKSQTARCSHRFSQVPRNVASQHTNSCSRVMRRVPGTERRSGEIHIQEFPRVFDCTAGIAEGDDALSIWSKCCGMDSCRFLSVGVSERVGSLLRSGSCNRTPCQVCVFFRWCMCPVAHDPRTHIFVHFVEVVPWIVPRELLDQHVGYPNAVASAAWYSRAVFSPGVASLRVTGLLCNHIEVLQSVSPPSPKKQSVAGRHGCDRFPNMARDIVGGFA